MTFTKCQKRSRFCEKNESDDDFVWMKGLKDNKYRQAEENFK